MIIDNSYLVYFKEIGVKFITESKNSNAIKWIVKNVSNALWYVSWCDRIWKWLQKTALNSTSSNSVESYETVMEIGDNMSFWKSW